MPNQYTNQYTRREYTRRETHSESAFPTGLCMRGSCGHPTTIHAKDGHCAWLKCKCVGPLVGLTPREFEVLREMAQGYIIKEIAQRMDLSCKTVTTYRRNLFLKLGTHSQLKLVLAALRLRLFELDDLPEFDIKLSQECVDACKLRWKLEKESQAAQPDGAALTPAHAQ